MIAMMGCRSAGHAGLGSNRASWRVRRRSGRGACRVPTVEVFVKAIDRLTERLRRRSPEGGEEVPGTTAGAEPPGVGRTADTEVTADAEVPQAPVDRDEEARLWAVLRE